MGAIPASFVSTPSPSTWSGTWPSVAAHKETGEVSEPAGPAHRSWASCVYQLRGLKCFVVPCCRVFLGGELNLSLRRVPPQENGA